MALPVSRNTSYSVGSQVKSADLNDLQDKVIDLWAWPVVTPSALGSGNANDYNPAGIATGTRLIRQDLSDDAGATITGLAGGVNGRMLALQSLHATRPLYIAHESASSTAANRLYLPGAADRVLFGVGTTAVFRYDGTLSRWVLIGGASSQLRTTRIAGCDFHEESSSCQRNTKGGFSNADAAGNHFRVALRDVPVGARLLSISIDLFHGTGSSTRTYALKRTELDTGYTNSVVSSNTATNSSDADFNVVILSTDHTVADNYVYFVEAEVTEIGDGVQGCSISWIQP